MSTLSPPTRAQQRGLVILLAIITISVGIRLLLW